MLWLLLCMVGAAAALDPPLPCPCGNARLCGPLDAAARAVLSARPEVTAFYGETSTSSSREILSTPSYWLSFDWGSITTVAVNGWFDRTMVCYAHSRGVRVVALVGCDGGPCHAAGTAAARATLVSSYVATMAEAGLDGIIYDFEHIPSGSGRQGGAPRNASAMGAMRELVAGTRAAAPQAFLMMYVQGSPDYGYEAWMGTDVAEMMPWLDIIVASGYGAIDLTKLPEAVDCFGRGSNMLPCPISSPAIIRRAAAGWVAAGVPLHKLVLGLNWYAISYPTHPGKTEAIVRMSQCEAHKLVSSLPTNATHWDADSATWVSSHTNATSGAARQLWHDDATSLGVKYSLAAELGFRGVGVWKASGMWSDKQATWPSGLPRPGSSGPLFDVETWCPEQMASMWASLRTHFLKL